MTDLKICVYCKNNKPLEMFQKIIKRKTYGLDCDDDGYVYYVKELKICSQCRLTQYEHTKRYRKRKYNDMKIIMYI